MKQHGPSKTFSYLQSAKDLRSSKQNKLTVARHLIQKTACLTPPTVHLLEKHFLSNAIINGDGDGDGDADMIVDDTFWDITNSLLPSISRSLNKSTEAFLLQVLRYAVKSIGPSTACQSTLRSLFGTSHLYQPKFIASLISVLAALVDASTSSRQPRECLNQPQLLELTNIVLDIILDSLSRLRDVTRTQSFAIRIAPILCSHPQLVPRIPALHPYIFIDTGSKSRLDVTSPSSHPFLALLDAQNVRFVIPSVLSSQKRNSDYVVYIINLCIQKLNSQLIAIVNDNKSSEQVPVSKLLHCLSAIIAVFSVIISQNISFTSFPKNYDSTHPANSIFTSLVKLLHSTISSNRVQSEKAVSTITEALVLMIQMINFNHDENTPFLLDVTADLISVSPECKTITDSMTNIVKTLIKSYTFNRRLAWFFKQLAQFSGRNVQFVRLNVILCSSSILSMLAQSISDLPLGSVSHCISALVPQTTTSKKLARDDQECLSFLVSMCLESAPKKDLPNVLQTISKQVVPCIISTSSPSNNRESRSSCMFLVASVLLTILRDKSTSAVDAFLLLSNGILSTIFGNVTLSWTKDPDLRKLKKGSQFSQNDVMKLLLFYLKDKDVEQNNSDGVCLLRLLSYALRLFLENKDIFDDKALTNQAKALVDLIFRQCGQALKSSDNIGSLGNAKTGKYCVFIRKGIVEDTLFTFASLSDVIDSFGGNMPDALVPILCYFVRRWNSADKTNELFERRFVRDALGDVIYECLKELKESLKENAQKREARGEACPSDVKFDAVKLLNFILETPRSCLREEQENKIVRKIASISKWLPCDDSRRTMVITLFFLRQGGGDRVLSEWTEDWQSLDTAESRFSICCEVSSHGERGRSMLRSMCRVITDHFKEWSKAVNRVVNDNTAGNHVKLQVFKIGLFILKIDALMQSSAIAQTALSWEEMKCQLNGLIEWMTLHVGWYSLCSEKAHFKDDDRTKWISCMLAETKDLKNMLHRLETNYENDAMLYAYLQMAGFCLVTKPWVGPSVEDVDVRTSILRCMLKIGTRIALVYGNSDVEKVFNAASLCFQCSECVLRHHINESIRRRRSWTTLEMICLHCTDLLGAITQNCHVPVDQGSIDEKELSDQKQVIVDLLSRMVSCIIFVLKSQRAHCMRWSVINLMCYGVKLAGQLGKSRNMGQQCGQAITELMTTVDWCYGQGIITDDIIKSIILGCAQCLAQEYADAQFELSLLNALARLLQAVPRREAVMSALIACASPSMTVILGNISQRAQRIEYAGQ